MTLFPPKLKRKKGGSKRSLDSRSNKKGKKRKKRRKKRDFVEPSRDVRGFREKNKTEVFGASLASLKKCDIYDSPAILLKEEFREKDPVNAPRFGDPCRLNFFVHGCPPIDKSAQKQATPSKFGESCPKTQPSTFDEVSAPLKDECESMDEEEESSSSEVKITQILCPQGSVKNKEESESEDSEESESEDSEDGSDDSNESESSVLKKGGSERKITRRKSPYVGVSWDTRCRKWRATISHEKRQYWIGSFVDDREAAKAVNEKCMEIGIPRKNPDLSDDECDEAKKAKKTCTEYVKEHKRRKIQAGKKLKSAATKHTKPVKEEIASGCNEGKKSIKKAKEEPVKLLKEEAVEAPLKEEPIRMELETKMEYDPSEDEDDNPWSDEEQDSVWKNIPYQPKSTLDYDPSDEEDDPWADEEESPEELKKEHSGLADEVEESEFDAAEPTAVFNPSPLVDVPESPMSLKSEVSVKHEMEDDPWADEEDEVQTKEEILVKDSKVDSISNVEEDDDPWADETSGSLKREVLGKVVGVNMKIEMDDEDNPWADDDDDDDAWADEIETTLVKDETDHDLEEPAINQPREAKPMFPAWRRQNLDDRLADGRRTYVPNVRTWCKEEEEIFWLSLARYGLDLGKVAEFLPSKERRAVRNKWKSFNKKFDIQARAQELSKKGTKYLDSRISALVAKLSAKQSQNS